jgi:hypothetical protein
METTVLRNNPPVIYQKIPAFSDDADIAKGVVQALVIVDVFAKSNRSFNLLIHFPGTDASTLYSLTAHKIWSVGFRQNETVGRLLRKTAVVARYSPKFDAERAAMESATQQFFSDFNEALTWLISS